MKSHAETVRVLLQHGIPFDIRSKDGKTCVKMAESLDVVNVIEEETGLGFNDLFDDDFDDDDKYYDIGIDDDYDYEESIRENPYMHDEDDDDDYNENNDLKEEL
jgi:hypothetical protein